MIEVERKFRLSQEKKDQVFTYLENKSGSASILKQSDTIFLFNTNSFSDFKYGDPLIRIRLVDGVANLTFKRRVGTEGNMIEHELTVDSASKAEGFVREIGFLPTVIIEKERREYKIKGVTCCLDEVKNVGSFLEIEIICDAQSAVQGAEEKIMKLAIEMGLSSADLEVKKYDELVVESEMAL